MWGLRIIMVIAKISEADKKINKILLLKELKEAREKGPFNLYERDKESTPWKRDEGAGNLNSVDDIFAYLERHYFRKGFEVSTSSYSGGWGTLTLRSPVDPHPSSGPIRYQYAYLKIFPDRPEKQSKEGGLVSLLKRKLFIFLLFVLGGIILSIFSLQSTGNAIGNLTGTTQGLLGIFLFVFGIAGLVFSSGKRY